MGGVSNGRRAGRLLRTSAPTVTIARAAELIGMARRGLALTGAGVSAESGIPTFRGAGGLWTRYDPVKVASIDYFMADPSAYWSVSKDRGRVALAARPNPGHHALAALEARGRIVAVVTQNTDGLHQDSGSRTVIEVHGSSRTVQWPKFGNATIPLRPTRSISRSTFNGARVSCRV